MDLSTMQSEARLIFGEPDTANTHISNTQLATWANEFYMLVCAKLRSFPLSEMVYDMPSAATPTITLNAWHMSIDIAKAKILPSGDWRELKIIDVNELLAMDPDWENAPVGEPTHFVLIDTNTARLYPPPNTSNASQADSVKTFGSAEQTQMSASGDVPKLPYYIHPMFPHYMAYKAFLRLQDREQAAVHFSMVKSYLPDGPHIAVNKSRKRGWRIPGADGPSVNAISLG